MKGLEDMTLKELMAEAKAQGIKGRSKMKKAELLETLLMKEKCNDTITMIDETIEKHQSKEEQLNITDILSRNDSPEVPKKIREAMIILGDWYKNSIEGYKAEDIPEERWAEETWTRVTVLTSRILDLHMTPEEYDDAYHFWNFCHGKVGESQRIKEADTVFDSVEEELSMKFGQELAQTFTTARTLASIGMGERHELDIKQDIGIFMTGYLIGNNSIEPEDNEKIKEILRKWGYGYELKRK